MVAGTKASGEHYWCNHKTSLLGEGRVRKQIQSASGYIRRMNTSFPDTLSEAPLKLEQKDFFNEQNMRTEHRKESVMVKYWKLKNLWKSSN